MPWAHNHWRGPCQEISQKYEWKRVRKVIVYLEYNFHIFPGKHVLGVLMAHFGAQSVVVPSDQQVGGCSGERSGSEVR